MEPSWKRNLRPYAVILPAIAIFFANVQLSHYVTDNLLVYIFDTPISVAYQLAYPIFASVLLAVAGAFF